MAHPVGDAAETPCAVQSLEAGEPLAGSAVEGVRTWVLVEHPWAWAPQVLDATHFTPDVRESLQGLEAGPHGVRVQLVRRPVRPADDLLHVLVVPVAPGAPAHRLVIDGYEALLDLDLPGLVAGATPDDPRVHRHEEPLWLVCTHGKRDPCCARLGPAIWRALAHEEGDRVWQTSHLGGHRFAPTLVHLPTGLCYGRVAAGDAPALVEAHAHGRVASLDHLRGRTAWPAPAQVAEIRVRRATGIADVDALALAAVEPLEGEQWVVRIALGGAGGPEHVLLVERSAPTGEVQPSCFKETRALVRPWRVLSHETVG